MQDRILSYINDDLLMDQDARVGPEDELLLDNLLDSMDVVRLVTFIDVELGLEVPPEDITIDNFRTAGAIAGYLVQLKGDQGAA